MRNSLSRRIALKRPSSSELEALEAEIARQEELEDRDEAALDVLRAQRDAILARQRRISYIDPIDLRYRRYEPTPRMVTQADRKSTRLNSSHQCAPRMPSSA